MTVPLSPSSLEAMPPRELFNHYGRIVSAADRAFQGMAKDYHEELQCKPHCCDCCFALFGLFLIEAIQIRRHFEGLDIRQRREALIRGEQAERALLEFQNRLRDHKDDAERIFYEVGKERIRCPLLNDFDECILYSSRPITCRVYGIPTAIRGKARVCGKAAFNRGKYYPSFNLDQVNKQLYLISKAILNKIDGADPEKASLLISMPRAIKGPVEDLIGECFQ